MVKATPHSCRIPSLASGAWFNTRSRETIGWRGHFNLDIAAFDLAGNRLAKSKAITTSHSGEYQ